MEGSFDQELLVFERREPRNLHNKKPSHMSSVAGGVIKRLRNSIQHRRSVRLSGFDQGRDIPQEVYPTPIKEVQNEAQLKVEHRRQQLEKWKVEKAQKKKEEAMQKKKPFIAGIPHAPLYVLPPPPPKLAPSTSGRVTRATTRKAAETKAVPKRVVEKKVETQPPPAFTKSFAPKNATFKPPKLKHAVTLPPFTFNRDKPKSTITFDPVIHPTKSNISSSVSSSEGSSTMLNDKPKRKFVKTPMKFAKHVTSSSSDSDSTNTFKRNVQNRALPRKAQSTTQSSSSDTEKVTKQSSKPAEAKQTKKVAQPKPLPRQLQVSKPAPIQMVKESPRIEKRPTRAAKQKALTSIEQQRANKNKTIKAVLTKVEELSSQVVLEPLVIEKTKQHRKSISKPTGDITPKRAERKLVSSKNLTPKRPIPKSESSSEERIRLGTPKRGSPMSTALSTPSNLDSSSSASNISPFVCMSRGKDNARREMIQKAREGLLGAELEAEEDSVSYFRQLLDSEILKINLACDRWDAIYNEVELPEFVQGLVLSAVGQGRLLVAQKFRQFLSLIERCASAEGNIETVTVTDLRGFWDMIYLQVKNIDLRFSELEELRAKNWTLECHQSQQRPADSNKPAKTAADAKKKTARSRKSRATAGPSKIKEMIAAARKAKQQQDSDTYSTSSSTATMLTIPDEEKTFDAGFFSVRSPVRSPTTPNTPAANKSLLKTVLSSEARKACGSSSKNTSNAMLRASILGKNVQIDGVSPLEQTPKPIPINLNATPARSILKSGKKQSLMKSSKKSIKTVLFDQNESDESILASNFTTLSDHTEVNKENDVIYLSSTDSVQIIDSAKKSTRKSTETDKTTRNSDHKSTKIASAKKSIEQSNDTVESTKKSDQKGTETNTTKSTGKKSLQRQNALTNSPIMTRRQRKSLQPFLVDDLTIQTSVLKELDNITPNSTAMFDVSKDFVSKNPTPRRSKRLTQINSEEDDLIIFDSPVKIVARRSSKRRAVN